MNGIHTIAIEGKSVGKQRAPPESYAKRRPPNSKTGMETVV